MPNRLPHTALIALAIFATGCPTYEDAFTGTYRQVVEEDSTGPVYAVDLFRYGNFAQAVLRRYDLVAPNDRVDRFVEYSNCSWSEPGVFEPERASFDLQIEPDRVQDSTRQLVGLIDDDGTITANLRGNGELIELELERVTTEADDDCVEDRQFRLTAAFPDRNAFPEGVDYQIQDPALTVLWLGVLATNTGRGTVFSGTRQNPREAVRLDAFLTPERDGLIATGRNLSALWDAPDENVLIFSGSTRYTLGHIIVVDDRDDSDDQFSWNIAEEPIVAAGVTRGRRESVAIEHNGFGRVLLYVEGDLRDLDEALLRRINVLSGDGSNFITIDELPDTNRNFFVADAFFFNDEIVRMDVWSIAPVTTVKVTTDWLDDDEINLPRLFP